MTQKIGSSLIVFAALALGGCVVPVALTAADMAPRLSGPLGPSNAHLKPNAVEACTRQAAQYGSVYILDVEQRRSDRLIVWGSVTDAQQQRRAFECHFTTTLSRFRLH